MTKFILLLAAVFSLSVIAQAADPTPTPSPAPSASAGKAKHHHGKKGAPKASPSPTGNPRAQ